MIVILSKIVSFLQFFVDISKNTILWKGMMRSFRWIEMNCFNIFRFIGEVRENLLKMHYFGQLKDHNSGKKKWNWTNDPIFFIYFLSSNCLWYSFLYLKIAKIHLHGVLLLSILVCKIPEFWRCKLWNQNFISFDSGNIRVKESKKPGLLFLLSWEPNFSDVMV